MAIFQHYEWKDFGQIVGQKSNPIYKFWRLESAHHLMLLWPISVKINHFINEKFLNILQERRTFFHCTWTFSRILIWANFNSRKKKENSIFFQKMTFSLTWKKKHFMAPCLWMGFIWLKAIQPLRGDSLHFTIKFPGVPGTQLIDLRSLSWLWNHPVVLNPEPLDWESSTLLLGHWLSLSTTQCFWTQDLWIGNPAP